MKKIIILTTCLVYIIACSKKSVPSTSAHTPLVNADTSSKTPLVNVDTNSNVPPVTNADTASAVTANANMAVMVVSDANGKIINSEKDLPPDAGIKFDHLQLSKGFTPQQKINLSTRYKTIPPRVLYVSKQYQLNSLRGTYYILKKKFWYWKKKDGLFYLDEKYYL